MFEILILILIGWMVYRKIKANQEDGGVKGNNSLPNTTATTPVQTLFGKVNEKSQGQQGAKPPMAQPYKTAHEAIREAREDGNSTTAYLMEKAEADQREHAREKFEEQKRLYETRGGLAVAERYLDGDIIPQGKKCVICGYCGAENLIPIVPRTKYSCYFCREAL